MKQAVMYGAGNIGRGFIGALFSLSGYRVTFVDVAQDVVDALVSRASYPIRYIAGTETEDVLIENVTAVNGNDADRVADIIATCDIMATAVGARIMPKIAPVLAKAVSRRCAARGGPFNIIICENLMDANKILEGLIKEGLTEEECVWMEKNVGLVEASIGRMVPVQTDEMHDGDMLRVCEERYGFLPVDRDAFRGDIPDIRNMVPFSPFDFYLKRKLYVHNMGHSTCAYLGDYLGLTYIYESIDVAEIRVLVQNAMLESASALSAEYNIPLEEIEPHIGDLLHRFTNAALGDTCARVGGDPARKLSPADRMTGSAKLVLKQGGTPSCITVGAAAAVRRYIAETDGMTQSEADAQTVLREVCGLSADDRLYALIMQRYRMFLAGKSLTEIRRFADAEKAAGRGDVI